MTILLKNVIVATARSFYDPDTLQTGKPQPYLDEIEGHIHPTAQSRMRVLSTSALESEFELLVEPETDIAPGDQILSIVLIEDRTTPWPGFNLRTSYEAPEETFWVKDAVPGIPGPLNARYVYISRERSSGQSY